MKTIVLLFSIVLVFLSVTIAPQARATCREGCFATQNTVLGDDALLNGTGPSENVAIGDGTLQILASGSVNTAVGSAAMPNNTSGALNTGIGGGVLFSFDAGVNNTAIGAEALWRLQTGNYNIALGSLAGINLTHGDSNIYIGNAGTMGENRKIRIGATGTHANAYIAGISGVTVPGGVGVIIDSSGHLGTVVSSARFKEAIKPMDKASEAILALKPVTFRYKHDLDPSSIPQFGLVAEEVEKVNPDLVARDEQGKPYTVRYEAVNAMLLNEFLKAHRKIQELEATNAQHQRNFAEQQKQIEVLAAGLQKVNAQLELTKCAPRTVLNDQ